MTSRIPSVTVRSSSLTGDAAGYFYSQPLPAAELPRLDPFLLLHHHGPMDLTPDNAGMPFGPHPHRGFCTLTVILAGSVVHQDSHGFKSRIDGSAAAAGAQWMTAGRGLIHNESTPRDFNESGGPLELLQLWINLPARLKMTPAHYEGLTPERVPPLPLTTTDPSGPTIQLFTGTWPGQTPAFAPPTAITTALLRLPASTIATLPAPAGQSVIVYVLRGKATVAEQAAKPRVLYAFAAEPSEGTIEVKADDTDEIVLFYVAGEPLNEPVVQHGPFVMNSEREIMEAMRDYQMGKMGVFIDE
jgi:quercetin 2,3-dioxygenase